MALENLMSNINANEAKNIGETIKEKIENGEHETVKGVFKKGAPSSETSHTAEKMSEKEFVVQESTKAQELTAKIQERREERQMAFADKHLPSFFTGLTGLIKWGGELVAKGHQHVRDFQLAVVEKSPDIAKLSLEVGERIEKLGASLEEKNIEYRTKTAELTARYFGDLNSSFFAVVNQFVAKVDWTQVILKAQEIHQARAEADLARAEAEQSREVSGAALREAEVKARIAREDSETIARNEQSMASAAYYHQQAETEKHRTEERKLAVEEARLRVVQTRRDLGLMEDGSRPEA